MNAYIRCRSRANASFVGSLPEFDTRSQGTRVLCGHAVNRHGGVRAHMPAYTRAARGE